MPSEDFGALAPHGQVSHKVSSRSVPVQFCRKWKCEAEPGCQDIRVLSGTGQKVLQKDARSHLETLALGTEPPACRRCMLLKRSCWRTALTSFNPGKSTWVAWVGFLLPVSHFSCEFSQNIMRDVDLLRGHPEAIVRQQGRDS